VRGAVIGRLIVTDANRITPACAGSRWRMSTALTVAMDHPRVCGEQLQPLVARLSVGGSPPRVRGAVSWTGTVSKVTRITPACAGSRQKSRRTGQGRTDHPRVCGEQTTTFKKARCATGSPPRVRGAAKDPHHGTSGRRITPACAGSRSCFGFATPKVPDHPRVCGEQGHSTADAQGRAGSPPRVRGAVNRCRNSP